MVRVPTYSTYINMMNGALKNKQLVDQYSFQSITGLKSQTYSGYGMSAYSIVSLEAALTVNNNYMENNSILEVELNTINTSLESIQSTIKDFKSMLTSFSGSVSDTSTQKDPDKTGGEITFTSDNKADYLGRSITINGTTYTFAEDAIGNNIDISAATSAQDVMDALENKLPANDKFTFNGTTFSYPLYTVDNTSSILNANGVKTGTPKSESSALTGNLTPDYTGGEISFSSNDINDYLGKTLTVNGTTYTFATNGDGNNIDISGLTSAEEIMNALKDKLPSNPEFKFEGTKFSFPLYTINGSSTVLKANGVTTGEPHTMSNDQYQEMKQLQTTAFSTLKMLVDSLNTFVNGKYLFGGGNMTQAPINFPFNSLEDFQNYYDGINIKFPESAAANLTNMSMDGKSVGNLTIASTGGNTATLTAGNAGGFLKEGITANDRTTGDLTFNRENGTIKATQHGAFSSLKAGDTIVIGGDGAGANAKAYTIKSVSSDGKTITVDEDTPIMESTTISPNDDVTFSTSFPVGSVINMEGFGSNTVPRVQVTGISDDGTTLYVTADPGYLPAEGNPQVIDASGKWSMETQSYYQGGTLSSSKMISDNQSLTFDINGQDAVFEQMFRALGQIAQGNLVDTRNPADGTDSLINSDQAMDRVMGSLDLIQNALFNSSADTSTSNPDLYSILAKTNSNTVLLNNVTENQTLVKNNLENNISSLKNVDKTEAATKLLLAVENLQASYSVMQTTMSLSILDYLK
ncbi:MAG: hypothetical protein J6L67_00935 [Alphaproteobacteria bacterium]|nr:hypothetical protein [Alphaproteobacteria bacterium]